MTKYALNFLAIILFNATVLAISPQWALSLGGAQSDLGTSIATDKFGNVYTIGSFQGTVDFDPSSANTFLTSSGGEDIFITKMDTYGNLIWAKSLGGPESDVGSAITLYSTGNFYLTGFFRNTVDFDPNSGISYLTSSGGADVFVVKFSSNANLKWAKRLGGASSSDYGRSITVDYSGNVYTTGQFSGIADFDPGSKSYEMGTIAIHPYLGQDAFISKLNSEGFFVWAKKVGSNATDDGNSIAADSAGNIYVTGYFGGTTDFDPGIGTYSLSGSLFGSIYVLKLNTNGEFVWAKEFGDYEKCSGYNIHSDHKENIYITGSFKGNVDFNPDTASYYLNSSNNQSFILKLDTLGKFQWVNMINGSGNSIGYSSTTDLFGNVYTTGWFSGTLDFDPSEDSFFMTSKGVSNAFVTKSDKMGNFISTIQIGKIRNNGGSSIKADQFGDVYCTGYFTDTVNFNSDSTNFSLVSNGDNDIFILKLNSNKLTGIENFDLRDKISIYPNPFTDKLSVTTPYSPSKTPFVIKNIEGLDIMNGYLEKNTTDIETYLLPYGFYFLEIGNKDKKVFKLIK